MSDPDRHEPAAPSIGTKVSGVLTEPDAAKLAKIGQIDQDSAEAITLSRTQYDALVRTDGSAPPRPEERESAPIMNGTATENRDRSRQMQAMISGGALGGGMLLAGFGIVPALVGMAAGGFLAYWLEHRAAKKCPQRAA